LVEKSEVIRLPVDEIDIWSNDEKRASIPNAIVLGSGRR